jgi:hypothetical protein
MNAGNFLVVSSLTMRLEHTIPLQTTEQMTGYADEAPSSPAAKN